MPRLSWFSENLGFKGLSILLALFVWYLAKQVGDPIQMSFFVPVVFKNLPQNFQVSSDPPQVNISARTKNRGGSLNPLAVQAIIDLSTAQDGQVEYVLTESNIIAPVDIHITRITPPKVILSIEELIEKTLPVQVHHQGEVQKGFLLDSIEITPPFVRVRGAKSQLAPIETVTTMVIDLSELSRSTEMIVQLDLPQRSLQILDEGVEFYSAQVNLRSLPVKKRFDNVPVYLRNTAYVSVINPNAFNIFVEGPAEVVQSLNASGLYGVIDLRKYKPGVYNKVRPTPILPEEVNILEQWPPISLWVKPETLEKSVKLKQRVRPSGFSARQR